MIAEDAHRRPASSSRDAASPALPVPRGPFRSRVRPCPPHGPSGGGGGPTPLAPAPPRARPGLPRPAAPARPEQLPPHGKRRGAREAAAGTAGAGEGSEADPPRRPGPRAALTGDNAWRSVGSEPGPAGCAVAYGPSVPGLPWPPSPLGPGPAPRQPLHKGGPARSPLAWHSRCCGPSPAVEPPC